MNVTLRIQYSYCNLTCSIERAIVGNMKSYEPYLGETEVSILSKIAQMIFGEDTQCAHGLRGSDGVCPDCCNDMFGASDDDYAEVIDFPALRDTI